MQLSGTHGVGLDDTRARRVSDLLTEGFDGFSRSQKAVARYIIDHLEEVGYLSAEELGRKGSTSSSTVVRFAQSLGFAGYPELQRAARDEYRLGATVVVITDNSLSELADRGDLTLYADIDSTFFAHSLVGPISLVSALAAAIYSMDRDLYDSRVRAVRDRAAESGWLR
jgi:DNA-binding MurR/RpiR family transcriptional regulator